MQLSRSYTEEVRIHAQMKKAGWPDNLEKPSMWISDLGHFILLGRENCGGEPRDPMRWHISAQGPGRVPLWHELVEIAHTLRPGVPFVLGLPPESQWMSVHEHVLHLWECGDIALLKEFRVNALKTRHVAKSA